MMKYQKFLHNGFVLLILFGLFSFFGCQPQEEENFINNSTHDKVPTIETLNLKSAEKKNDFIELTKLFKADKFYDKYNSNGKKCLNKDIPFTINTDNFNRVELDDYVSYTFEILKDNRTDDFENLVVEKTKGKVKGYILKYKNPIYLKKGKNVEFHATLYKTRYTKDIDELLKLIEDPSQFKMADPDCGWQTVASLRYCPEHKVMNSNNRKCWNFGKDDWVYSLAYSCAGGGTSGSSIGSSTGSGSSSSEGGSGGGSQNNGNNGGGSITGVANSNPVKMFESFSTVSDALKNIPSQVTTIETKYAYLRNIGVLLQSNQNFSNLGQTLFNLSLDTTLVSQGEASQMIEKVVEIMRIIQFKPSLNQLTLSQQKKIAQNSLFVSFLPSLKSLGLEFPKTAEEWREFGELLVEVMKDLIPDLIPGVAELRSLKNAINAFKQGSYVNGSSELAFAIIGVFPAGKILKALTKFTKLIKKLSRIFKVYIKLFKLSKPLAKGFKKIITEPNTLSKIFASHHKLESLISKTGGKKEAILETLKKVNELGLVGALQIGRGKTFTVIVKGETLRVNMYKHSNGIVQISDMWKP